MMYILNHVIQLDMLNYYRMERIYNCKLVNHCINSFFSLLKYLKIKESPFSILSSDFKIRKDKTVSWVFIKFIKMK